MCASPNNARHSRQAGQSGKRVGADEQDQRLALPEFGAHFPQRFNRV
jgi:hypothetical protein